MRLKILLALLALMINLSAYAGPVNTDYERGKDYGVYAPGLRDDDSTDAILLTLDWNAVQPDPCSQTGCTYNFEPADREADAWIARGKRIAVAVRYIRENPGYYNNKCDDAKQFMPAWEINKLRSSEMLFCDKTTGALIPWYTNPTVTNDLKIYIKAVGDHYTQKYPSNIYYARVGLGIGSETLPVRDYTDATESTCPDGSNNIVSCIRYAPSYWENWQRMMLDYAKSSFSATTVIYTIISQDVNPGNNTRIQCNIARYAMNQGGYGFGAQGLGPKSSIRNNCGNAQIGRLFSEALQKNPNTLIQLQPYHQISGAGNDDYPSHQSELECDMLIASSVKASSVEWYYSDLQYMPFMQKFLQFKQCGAANCAAPAQACAAGYESTCTQEMTCAGP